jgi:hypothetical protein
VYLLVSQKETNIWPSICATNKKNEYTNKKVVILYAYPCIGPDKSLFWQHKYTKDGCEGKKPSHRRKTIFCVFVYWCIGVHGSVLPVATEKLAVRTMELMVPALFKY